ncbi:hypothetical protein [Candidatus Phytoplasma citri]|uniref:hypothetical protein n=1 Tax=Candidatus Phytoplasma citri TaxID=180978 RepID=UPI0034DB0D86
MVPFYLEEFNFNEIDAIYFDDGIRIFPPHQNYSLPNLLKLSNGAQKIYLFTFNTQKRIKTIELPDNADPYQAIRDWKRENNLYTFSPLIQEDEYDEISELLDDGVCFEVTGAYGSKKICVPVRLKVVKHEFDTNDCHYLLLCGNAKSQSQLAEQYCEKWKSWMRQCYIKYGNYYSEGEIRGKIGRSSKWLYDENGKSHWYSYKENPWYILSKIK